MRIAVSLLALVFVMATVANAAAMESMASEHPLRSDAMVVPPPDSLVTADSTIPVPQVYPYPKHLEMELGGEYYSLTNNFAAWNGAYVQAAYPLAPHETVYGQIEYLNEYSISDGDAFAGIYYPITKDLTAVVEGEVGFAQKITPAWSLFGQLEYKLFKGFLIEAGFRNSDYHNVLQSTNQVQIFNVGAEYWFSNFRAAYTFYESRGNGGIWNPPSHLLEFGYYYGDANSITLGAGMGHEVDLIAFTGGSPFLGVFDTKTVFLLGRHWFSWAWGMSYEIGWNQMDQAFSTNTLYDRYGIRLGIRHRF